MLVTYRGLVMETLGGRLDEPFVPVYARLFEKKVLEVGKGCLERTRSVVGPMMQRLDALLLVILGRKPVDVRFSV